MRLDNLSENLASKKEYFIEMLDKDSLSIVQPFLNDEGETLCNLIIKHSCMVFLGIGSGLGLYSDLISPYCKYIGIDPFYQSSDPLIINKQFQEVVLKRNKEKFIISFLFNLVSHVDKHQIIDFLNKNTMPGDIITISSWKSDHKSYSLRKAYLTHISKKIDISSLSNGKRIINLNSFDPMEINDYKNHEIIELRHSSILIIYL